MTNVAVIQHDSYDSRFANEVADGLGQSQKAIPCTWFYDLRGSELFEEITGLAEYYPTRSEFAILSEHLAGFGRRFGRHASIVEVGAGASRKTRLLLSALRDPYAYFPIDISAEFLFDAVSALQAEYPGVRCTPLILDFTEPSAMIKVGQRLQGEGPHLGFFPGSTIGNFAPDGATRLLAQLGRALGERGTLLIGIDSTQKPGVLLPAYDDAKGVTAAFNLNLLARINRELEGTFKIENFQHEARFNVQESRIEMHLVSKLPQRATVLGRTYVFRAGESIHTENSYKYSRRRFLELAKSAGWNSAEVWTKPDSGFEVHVLKRQAGRCETV